MVPPRPFYVASLRRFVRNSFAFLAMRHVIQWAKIFLSHATAQRRNVKSKSQSTRFAINLSLPSPCDNFAGRICHPVCKVLCHDGMLKPCTKHPGRITNPAPLGIALALQVYCWVVISISRFVVSQPQLAPMSIIK